MNIHSKVSETFLKLQAIRDELQRLVDIADPSQPYEVETKLVFKWTETVVNDITTVTRKLKKASVENPNLLKESPKGFNSYDAITPEKF